MLIALARRTQGEKHRELLETTAIQARDSDGSAQSVPVDMLESDQILDGFLKLE